jgi:hypothetical protein
MATLDAPQTTRVFPTGAFRRMGWAFLFLGISVGPSFRLGHENFLIDVLPDFVGYLMIATAANRLVPLHHRARGVRNLALLLVYLSIPTVIQYTVVTAQIGNVTTWKAPLWPLTVVVGLFELVLVWRLCGLVADLARRVGDAGIEGQAQTRRVVYVLLKILLTGGLMFVLVSPSSELIIGGVIASLVVGLLLLGLMMGLMWRAERMCAEWPESVLPSVEAGDTVRPGGWVFRVFALGGILLPMALAVGAFLYYQEWQQARDEARRTTKYGDYGSVRAEFCAHLLAGRIDEAYASTTSDFKTRISRERLAELARQYADYVHRPQHNLGASGAGASGGGYDFLTEYEYAEVEKGRIVQVTITIRRDRDSILLHRPPPLKVDDFQVEEKTAPEPMGPFGRPPGLGP